MAGAGTSLALMVPKRSTNEIRKYLMPCLPAISLHEAMKTLLLPDLLRLALYGSTSPEIALTRNPVGARERHACHSGGFDGESDQIFGLQIMDMALTASARDGLRFER